MFDDVSEEFKETLIHVKNVALVILILIDLTFMLAITFFDIAPDDLLFMAYFDLVICFILFLNLIFTYIHGDESLLQFLKTHLIDIIAIIPFNFIFLRYLMVFRVFRLLQLLSVVRIVNLKNLNDESFRYFVHNQLLKVFTIIVIAYMALSSIILYFIDDSFFSIFDAFWYNIATVAAVGYGDFTPSSFVGKVIGIITIIIGIFFISIFTAAMSSLYMEKPENKTREIIKEHINKIEEENNLLKENIEVLERETENLNEKIDKLINLVEKDK